MNQKHMDLISLQTQPFQNVGEGKQLEGTLVSQHLPGFAATFTRTGKRRDGPPGVWVILPHLHCLSHQGAQSHRTRLAQKATACWGRVCQPIGGLCLIKPTPGC